MKMKNVLAIAVLSALVACSQESLPSAPARASVQKTVQLQDSTPFFADDEDYSDVINAYIASAGSHWIDSTDAARTQRAFEQWMARHAASSRPRRATRRG